MSNRMILLMNWRQMFIMWQNFALYGKAAQTVSSFPGASPPFFHFCTNMPNSVSFGVHWQPKDVFRLSTKQTFVLFYSHGFDLYTVCTVWVYSTQTANIPAVQISACVWRFKRFIGKLSSLWFSSSVSIFSFLFSTSMNATLPQFVPPGANLCLFMSTCFFPLSLFVKALKCVAFSLKTS